MADAASLIRQPKSESAIRTMRSDVEEFLKTSKPTLTSLLAKQVALDEPLSEPNPRERRRVIALAVLVGVALTIGVLLYWRLQPPARPAQPIATAPAGFIFYETTKELAPKPTKNSILAALQQAAPGATTPGTFERVILREDNSALGNPLVGLAEFFRRLEIPAPPGLAESTIDPAQFFLYRVASGGRFGFIATLRNPARAIAALYTWEASMQHDAGALFLGARSPATFSPFQDQTYRNIDFRYLTIDPAQDLGIGYLHFEAEGRMVMTTSIEAMRAVINRLYQKQ